MTPSAYDDYLIYLTHGDCLIYLTYLAAYVLGSIPTAVWVSRLLHLQDPTTQGSNNPGATNMLRIAGKKPAIITFLGDFLKGTIAISIAIFFWFNLFGLLIVMLICLLGHMYPLFNRFVGGKGVATFFGCMLLVDVNVGLSVAVCWLVLAKCFKISSLAAIVSMTVAPLLAWWMGWLYVEIVLLSVICLLILWRHKANIRRLVVRQEK